MSALPFDIPATLLSQASLGPLWAGWLDRLPGVAAALAEEWDLRWDGAPMHGFTSLVVPVTAANGPAVLKVSFDGEDESLHEGLALRHWGGDGTVQLLRADPHRRALLLERLHTRDLTSVPELDACEIIADSYRHLHLPALPQLRSLASYMREWTDGLAALPRDAPLPRRLVEQAVSLGNEFVADPASAGTMIHGDLHYANVLAADRAPWIVIDPKPMSGDPSYEIAPLLWNRWEELAAGDNLREAIRRRFHTAIDVAGFEEERAREWVVVRMVHNAFWAIEDAERVNRSLSADDRNWISRVISVAKAVQD